MANRSRTEIINAIGPEYLEVNIENDEFSYPKAYGIKGLKFKPIADPDTGRKFQNLDIRFVKENVSVLIETKDDFSLPKNKSAKNQLSAYVEYEKTLTGNKIIAILANTDNTNIKVWRGAVSDANEMTSESAVRTMDEYVDFYNHKINDKEKIMQNTYALNNLLHKHSIPERLRSQFVGTCLLALKNGLIYKIGNTLLSTDQILADMRSKLEELLNKSMNRAEKLTLLSQTVLQNQHVKELEKTSLVEILSAIENNILPFINDRSTAGQDLLNLFFVTFNKYTGKADKNQAFTPDHITDFMCKVIGVNRNSRVLDICCGSGSFLVRAMTQELDDCATAKEQEEVKRTHIYGIEYDENIYGLATTNMLIHGDGNSNIIKGSCFDNKEWIQNTAKPDIILMNPPYNCQRASMDKDYVSTWNNGQKEDPSKGLYFVKWIADVLSEKNMKAMLAVLLPLSCAMAGEKNRELCRIKKNLLKNNTLKAVFSLPNEIFYPGANPGAVCCMVFEIGTPHVNKSVGMSYPTFFGYYKDDGFRKKKNIGRVEKVDEDTGESKWESIEKEWLRLYANKEVKDGISAVHTVCGQDEWTCEAYMMTDYAVLSIDSFRNTLTKYLAYLIKENRLYKAPDFIKSYAEDMQKGNFVPVSAIPLRIETWKEFQIKDLFRLESGKCSNSGDLKDGKDTVYVGAKKVDNGVMKHVEKEDRFMSRGNCMIFIGNGEGSAGYANYMDMDMIAATSLTLGYADFLNAEVGLFMTTLLDLEYPKFSRGRSWVGDRLANTVIRLPAVKTASGYMLDVAFMESYMKAIKPIA